MGGLPSGRAVTGFDGSHNMLVFLRHRLGEVNSAGFIGACHTCCILEELGQIIQRANQKWVARCMRNGSVKFNVLFHPIVPVAHRIINVLHGQTNGQQICARAALGGKFSDLGLECAAYFHYLHDRIFGCGMWDRKIEGFHAQCLDKHTTALP